jgi:hypothetical protein
MTITVQTKNKTVIDIDAIARLCAARVPGLVLDRVNKGLDINDKPFAPYSASYREQLAEMGEGADVDLRQTGGLLNSVRHVKTDKGKDVITLHFAPDAGSSAQVKAPRTGKARAKRTGKRSPAHNVVGYWLHHGTPRMRPRPWLGLSPKDRQALAKLLDQLKKTKGQGT